MQRFIAICLMIIAVLIGSWAHAQESISSPASEKLREWKALGAEGPGVYVKGETLYAFLRRPWSQSNRNQHKRWAHLEAAKTISDWLVTQNVSKKSSLSEAEISVIRHSGVLRNKLTLSGHVLFSGNKNNYFEHVEAYSLGEAKTQFQRINLRESLKAGLTKIRNEPKEYTNYFVENQLQDIALINKIRNSQWPNVHIAAISAMDCEVRTETDAKNQQAIRALEGKDELAEALKAALLGVDDPVTLTKILQKSGIQTVEVSYQTPVLCQVARCQGFVRFAGGASSSTPKLFVAVKEDFARGKRLEMLTALLEYMIEQSPRDPILWEYLAAAYQASEQKTKELLANRVWYSLAPTQESLKALLMSERNKKAVEMLMP